MSQLDETTWYFELTSVIDQFECFDVIKYLQSEEAREEKSHSRSLIESAVNFFQSLCKENQARILMAAFALGGQSLAKYISVTQQLEKSDRVKVEGLLAKMLATWLSVDFEYADWLSKNLHRLNNDSIEFLFNIQNESKPLVQFSIIVTLTSEKDRLMFCQLIRGVEKSF